MAQSLSSSLKKLKSQQELKAEAVQNTTITRGSKRNGYETVKEGVPLDHDTKHKTAKKPVSFEGQQFGMSKGCTLNMGEYESLRVDCWLSDTVRENETVREAFTRVEAVLDEVLEEVALNAKE